MAIFEKTEYWGLKDPLEVQVQHGTCIYMGDTFSNHFEPKKFNRVGRRGQKQPKWGIFGAFEKSSSKLTSNWPFWLKQIYRDIKFILRGLPERCDAVYHRWHKTRWALKNCRLVLKRTISKTRKAKIILTLSQFAGKGRR